MIRSISGLTNITRNKAVRSLKFIISILVIAVILGVAFQYYQSLQETAPETPDQSYLEVKFFDLGQADCTLIRNGTHTMLIDTGANQTASKLVGILKSMEISSINVLVGTHPHEDHIGGMDAVIKQFKIETIYMPDVVTTTQTFSDVLDAIEAKALKITHPEAGTIFDFGSARCTVLAPNSTHYEDINNYSIVIKTDFGKNSFLFMGDAENTSELEMLSKKYDLKADVLKVGHHGSDSSTGTEFLKAVSPRYAVIFIGKDNDYGHPSAQTLQKLNDNNVIIFRTDLNGTVTVKSDGNDLTFTTDR